MPSGQTRGSSAVEHLAHNQAVAGASSAPASISDAKGFDRALAALLAIEGGYYADPRGGPTQYGVTQDTYSRYYPGDVRDITLVEARRIYRDYWGRVRASEFPPALAWLLFDGAVNSGPEAAIRWVQAGLGVHVDGIVGPQTLAAAWRVDQGVALRKALAARWDFVRAIKDERTGEAPDLRHIGGWVHRLVKVSCEAVELAAAWRTT